MDIGVTFEDCICTVDFYLDDEYPYCDIEFSTKDEDYQKLRQTELVAEMPVYPQEGYIQQVGDIVIVKVSEDYLIDE